MKIALALLSLLLAVVPAAPAVQEAPADEPAQAGPEAPAGETPDEPPTAPAGTNVKAGGTMIADIDAHRVERLPYVRTFEEYVRFEVPEGIDLDADVVLVVGGKEITRDAFRRRALMYGGVNHIENHITSIVTLEEIEQREALGEDTSHLVLDEEDIDAKYEELKELVRMQAENAVANDPEQYGPVEDPGATAIAEFEEAIEQSVGMEAYRELLSAQAVFEKVFLPMPAEPTGEEVWDPANGPVPDDDPKPEWLPTITWAALSMDDNGKTLRQFIKSSGAQGGEIPSFFKPQIISSIRKGILKLRGVDFFFDVDLPEGVFLRIGRAERQRAEEALETARAGLERQTAAETVDEAAVEEARRAVAAAEAALAEARERIVDVRTDDLWALLIGDLVDTDIELILRELLTLEGMERTLKQAGRWLDDQTVEEAFADHEATYEGTLFPLQAMIMFRGYSSMDRYREHFRYRESYNRWRKETMSDEDLEDHYRMGGRLFFERGNIVVDLAYKGTALFGYDDDAFDAAEDMLMEAFAEWDGDSQEGFREIASQFPLPVQRQAQGNDRSFQRNPLRMRLTESDLSIFLTGYSLADDMFYHGVPGQVFGPWREECRRHAWGAEVNTGVWFGRVAGYSKARPLGPLEGNNYIQAEQDFLDLNYLYWSQECLEEVLPKVKTTD